MELRGSAMEVTQGGGGGGGLDREKSNSSSSSAPVPAVASFWKGAVSVSITLSFHFLTNFFILFFFLVVDTIISIYVNVERMLSKSLENLFMLG